MARGKNYKLGDDQPKENPWEDDRLGFAPFAQTLATLIQNLDAPNGYVIGLHGQWGSGKSTILNFVKAYLNESNKEIESDAEKIQIVDFRPWIVAGHQDLVAAFFKVLSESLGPADCWIVRRFKGIVRFIRGGADNLIDSVATIAVAIDPTAGVASGATGAVAKKSLGNLMDRFIAEPSLQKAYHQLKKQLVTEGRRFLVTIDDLDRLQEEEVRSIMQMVKTIGQLPNVIYVLAYDRKKVWHALDGDKEPVGQGFAEKIVQQEIELPIPSRSALLSMLDQEIGFLTGSTEENSRWHYIVRDGVQRWVRCPRDIIRLSNAVKFSWPALQGEIDPQDLLAMDGLRLFDETAFGWLRENRDFLFAEGRFSFAEDEEKKVIVSALRRRLSDETQSQVLSILAVLFPSLGGHLGDKLLSSSESFAEIAKRRGVGSAAGYDAYFGLRPSADEILKATINKIVQSQDVDEIEKIVRSYFGKKNSRRELMIGKLLSELRIHFIVPNAANPEQALLDALFRTGEDIIAMDGPDNAFVLPPRAEISFLIGTMLGVWGVELAGQRLLKALSESGSPAFCSMIYIDRGIELGVFKSQDRETPTITENDFILLGDRVLKKISTAVELGTLHDAPYFFHITRAWAHLDAAEKAKHWLVQGMSDSAEVMVKIGRGLVGYTVGSNPRKYNMSELPDPDLYDLSTIVSAGKKHLANFEISGDQRNLISELVRGAEAFVGRNALEPHVDADQ